MSDVYFVFSDECGNYKKNPGENFLGRNPYYIRSAYIINALEWFKLRKMRVLKFNYGFNVDDEIKWSDIWNRKRQGKNIETEIKYVEDCLAILKKIPSCKIICTVTFNNAYPHISESKIKRMHLQDIMQRAQMEIQSNPFNLGVLFLDMPSDNKELKHFQEIYKEIFRSDNFFHDFPNLKDAINFEPSHHSVGIQLADYIAGCFRGFLSGYEPSRELFKKFVYPLIAKNEEGNPLGFGIIEIPTDNIIREKIRQKLKEEGLCN